MKKTFKNIAKKSNNKVSNDQEMLNGIMSYLMFENGLRSLDFVPFEYAEVKPFVADCKVQVMHDGNVYINERPKRIHNTPLFREDNSSLTLGRDGKYYFVFTMPAVLVDELPEQLVLQAVAIAKKMVARILEGKEVER